MPAAAPVPQPERISSLDTLRGFALLGILVMNIQSFSILDCLRHLARPIAVFTAVVEIFPVRPLRMAMAFAHLLVTPADAPCYALDLLQLPYLPTSFFCYTPPHYRTFCFRRSHGCPP